VLIVLPGTRYAAKPPFEGTRRLVERQRTANPAGTGVGQRALAAVSTITASLSASRECRSGGMTSRSPLRPSQLVLPALSRTCPLSTMIVASPGLLCSVSDDPPRRAITVCRRTCSCPPKTVEELRPLDASRARSSCSRPIAGQLLHGLRLSPRGTRRGCGCLPESRYLSRCPTTPNGYPAIRRGGTYYRIPPETSRHAQRKPKPCPARGRADESCVRICSRSFLSESLA